MTIALRVSQQADTVTIQPGSYDEALKQTLSGSPGLAWDARARSYKGCYSAARVALARVKAADLAKIVGDELKPPEATLGFMPLGLDLLPLRAYQADGVRFIANQLGRLGAAWLCDDMGLGKTLQAITAAEAIKATRILVVCPAIAKQHWEMQITKWATRFGTATELPADDQLKKKADRQLAIWNQKRWHVVSYEALTKLPPCSYDLVIFDEIHYLANPKTKRYAAAVALLDSNPNAYRLGLSGTPITARTRDIYGPLSILFPGHFGTNRFAFEKRYCDGHKEELKMGPITKDIWVAEGSSHLDELTSRLYDDGYCLRRTKQQVLLELPPLTREVIEVEPSETLKATTVASLGDMLAAAEATKIESAIELANQLLASGRRPLILTLRKETANRIAARLDVNPVTGDTPAGERANILQAASAGVATIYSVTTAIDLVSFDCQIHVGLDWVPSTILQAEARLHRIGQLDPVTIYYLVALGTVDEQVREKVIYRLDNFAEITRAEGDEFSTSLRGGTDDDLLAELEAAIMGGL